MAKNDKTESTAAPAGFVPKTKKVLTLPLIKFVEGEPRYVLITSAMFVGKEMKPNADGKKKEPAVLANVTDLESGEVGQIIISAVVKSVLVEEYPNDSYVGKGFAITKLAKSLGKEYNKYKVVEIEV